MNNTVQLSVTTRLVPTRFDVVQYATAPVIEFYISDYTPTGSARIYIEKPSGAKVYNNCTIDGQSVLFTPTTQAFAEVGVNRCQLEIMDGETVVLSFLIYANVIENIIDSSAVESTDEFTALEEALSTVSQYDSRIAQNTSDIASQGARITQNENDIASQGARITQNETDIATNTQSIETLDEAFSTFKSGIMKKLPIIQNGKEISSWTSGTATIQGSENYQLFVVMTGTSVGVTLAVRAGTSIRGSGLLGTTTADNYTQYARVFEASASGEDWTYQYARQLTHNTNTTAPNHSNGQDQAVIAIYGLI